MNSDLTLRFNEYWESNNLWCLKETDILIMTSTYEIPIYNYSLPMWHAGNFHSFKDRKWKFVFRFFMSSIRFTCNA